jgi:hypothetical protein
MKKASNVYKNACSLKANAADKIALPPARNHHDFYFWSLFASRGISVHRTTAHGGIRGSARD